MVDHYHRTGRHKKGARNLVSNYRPVSLASIFCKMMESLIKDHVMNYLTAQINFTLSICGFMPEDHVLPNFYMYLDYITKHLDSGHSVDLIFKRHLTRFHINA